MKTYLHKIINNKNMDNDLEEERFSIINKQLEKQKTINIQQKNTIDSLNKKIDSLNKKIDSLNKEINILNEKMNKLDANYDKLKGRFIFRAFIDYIYVIFNININLKNTIKNKILIELAEKKKYNISYILVIIKFMEKLYYNETDNSHYIPKKEEIKGIILAQFNERNDKFIFDLFQKLHPETIIQKIMEKNNELTKLFNSIPSKEERDKQKSLIMSEINGIISLKEKENSIKIIKEITDDCKNKDKIKYYDEYGDDYDDNYYD